VAGSTGCASKPAYSKRPWRIRMQMQNWIVAMIPPLLVWCGLFLYLLMVDKKAQALEQKLAMRDSMPPYPR
jgi:hypothetical protein